MAQRVSGYDRKAGDAYWTPQWVFDALYSVEDFREPYDCAPRDADFDFLTQEWVTPPVEIVTNPPFSKADAFIKRALEIVRCKAAFLLPMTFDAGQSRRGLFKPPFKVKYTLTKRIRWENLEQKKNGPSTNHAWYVWDKAYEGPQLIGWLP